MPATLEHLETRALMAAGFLDPSFDGDGRVIRTDYGLGTAVVVQPDGKTLTAGRDRSGDGTDFLLLRYNPDGSPDTSFGGDGRVTTSFGLRRDEAVAVALQRDGRIVAVGLTNLEIGVARYNPDGTLDPTFSPGGDDGDGLLVLGFGGFRTNATDVTIQDDQRIVIAGYHSPTAPEAEFTLVRLTTAGALDPSFGTGGRVTTGHGLTIATAVAMAPGNKIVAVGGAEGGAGDSAIVRYNPDGSLDDTFGPMPEGQGVPPGIVRGAFEAPDDLDSIQDVVVDADSSILVAGHIATRGFTVARFTDDGLFYRKFDPAAIYATARSTARSVNLQRDGKVVAAGYTTAASGNAENFVVARYNPDGSADPTFGVNGANTTDFRQPERDGMDAPGTFDMLYGAALAPDGGLVAVGTTPVPGPAGVILGVVAKYLGDLDTSPAPVAITAGRGMTVTGTDRADDVRIFAAGPAGPAGARYVADLNGSLFPGDAAQAPKVNVFARGGDDLVRAIAGAAGETLAVPMDVSGGAGNDTLVGGASGDVLRGDDGNDGIDGGRGADAIFGGAGDDLLLASEAGAATFGDDYYSGGPGTDTINYAARSARVVLRLGSAGSGARGERDIVRGDIERAVGGAGNDYLEGTNGNNLLIGGAGNDTLLGRGGNDTLLGDAGDDVIADSHGTNVLDGGPGIDTVNGVREAVTEVTLEAENATLVGASVGRSNPGYTGTGYADYNAARDDSVEWLFNAPAAGQYTLVFRYANGGSADRPLELAVNGSAVIPRLSFAPTGGWTSWQTVTVTIQLAAGANRIRLTSVGSNGPNIDHLRIS